MQKSFNRRSRERRGLTMVDLVITVLILGFSAAIAVPRFSSAVNYYQIDSAARRIVGTITYASHQARITSQPVTLTFDTEADSVTLTGIEHPDHPGAVWIISFNNITDSLDLMSVDFSGNSVVTLGVDGRPNVTGTITLAVGASQRTITVSSSTGRATS